MDKNKKRLLNGIFMVINRIDYPFTFEPEELNWLLDNRLIKSIDEWRDKEGTFKSTGKESAGVAAFMIQKVKVQNRIEEHLSYLKRKEYIDYQKEGENTYRIIMFSEGLETARKLQSWSGRLNLWYKSNKDRIIWLLATIITSSLVTIITTLIINRLK